MTDIFQDLQWRGLIKDSTDPDELASTLADGKVTFYVGFDPTGPSLHIGHLTQILTARRLQRAGLRPLILVGGATGLIGDPKDTGERVLNSPDVVAGWVTKLQGQLAPFVEFAGDDAATAVNNLDWTGAMSTIEFLRDVGKHFPINQMLSREVVKNRLAAGGISFTEFSYQILQSNDFYELHRRHGCAIQFGGSDQWGNITAGVDFCRRRGVSVQAFTTPLVTRADGSKFGKTADGQSVWLDANMTSPYAFYQFWFNTGDADVGRYLRYFSFRPREEIEELEKATADRPAARAAQRALAEELTTLVHGERETAQVTAASRALFGRGDLTELDPSTMDAALTEAGLLSVSELPSVATLFKETGLCASLSEARRAVAEGGAYVNNERVTDADAPPGPETLLHNRFLVLRRGKRTIAGVALTR
ncbi:MAG TPA: tyrosine--tRNA ligase [Actinocatenispora sp.]